MLLERRSPWARRRGRGPPEAPTGWRRLGAAVQRRAARAGEELRATIAEAHPMQQALMMWLALGSLWTLAQVLDA